MQVPQKEAAATAPSFLFSGKTNPRSPLGSPRNTKAVETGWASAGFPHCALHTFPQNATLLHAFHTMQCCGHYVMHVTSIDYFFDRSLSSRDLSNHFQFYLHQIGNLTQKTPSITWKSEKESPFTMGNFSETKMYGLYTDREHKCISIKKPR